MAERVPVAGRRTGDPGELAYAVLRRPRPCQRARPGPLGVADPGRGRGGDRSGRAAAGRGDRGRRTALVRPGGPRAARAGRVPGTAAAALRRADPEYPALASRPRPSTRTRRARTSSSARWCWGTRMSAPGGVRSGATRSRSRWRWRRVARRLTGTLWRRRPRHWPRSSTEGWTLRSRREHFLGRPHRPGHSRQRAVYLAAPACHLARGSLRAGPGAAPGGPPPKPGGVVAAAGTRRSGGPGDRVPCRPGAGPRSDPGGADGDLAVRLPTRCRRGDGRRRRRPAGHRHHPRGLRRRAPGQLRVLRLARG